MEHERHEMRRQAARYGRLTAQTRIGTVDGVDPMRHTVRVSLQPEGVLTGWLPMAVLRVGPGWKLHALPPVGAQVVVSFQEGDGEAGIVLACLYDDQHEAPGGPVDGVWMVHENARVELKPDGAVHILSSEVRIGAQGAAFEKVLKEAAAAVYNTHTHPSNGAPPTQKITAAHMTADLKAN